MAALEKWRGSKPEGSCIKPHKETNIAITMQKAILKIILEILRLLINKFSFLERSITVESNPTKVERDRIGLPEIANPKIKDNTRRYTKDPDESSFLTKNLR